MKGDMSSLLQAPKRSCSSEGEGRKEDMEVYDFANVLFGGPCNQRCSGCIGQLLDPRLSINNLRRYPLRNQEQFARPAA